MASDGDLYAIGNDAPECSNAIPWHGSRTRGWAVYHGEVLMEFRLTASNGYRYWVGGVRSRDSYATAAMAKDCARKVAGLEFRQRESKRLGAKMVRAKQIPFAFVFGRGWMA